MFSSVPINVGLRRGHPTARRIISEALRLFAKNGIAGTLIVRIEEAAGLAPSSGAFYRHFKSKEAVLEAAVEDAASAASFDLDTTIKELPIQDQALFIARNRQQPRGRDLVGGIEGVQVAGEAADGGESEVDGDPA